jgi:hypothetical protein
MELYYVNKAEEDVSEKRLEHVELLGKEGKIMRFEVFTAMKTST